jgi:hypothetical protein
VREQLAQRHAGAVQARLHRGDRLADDLGHLLARQLLHVAQHQDRAVALWEPIHRRADDLASLPRQQHRVGHL